MKFSKDIFAKNGSCLVTRRQVSIGLERKIIPDNTVCFYDVHKNILYWCNHIPHKYDGKCQNVRLLCDYWDFNMAEWGQVWLKNCMVSRAIYTSFLAMNKPHQAKTFHEMDMNDVEQMMRVERKNKITGGSRRAIVSDDGTDERDRQDFAIDTKFREVTESAHWVHQPASIIATNIAKSM